MDELLKHVLEEEECDKENCRVHRPLVQPSDGPAATERELAFFIAGAQETVERFQYWLDEDLGLNPAQEYPTRRMRGALWTLTNDVRKAVGS